MAKKVVASVQKGEGRTFSKVIKMVKSPKTGAYMFTEEMVPNDKVKDFLNKWKNKLFPTYKEGVPKGHFLFYIKQPV